jgi:TonB family protein
MKLQIALKLGGLIVLYALLCSAAAAQESNNFAKDGLEFAFPTGWILTDQSTAEAQHLVITKKNSSAEIVVLVKRGLTLRGQVSTAQSNLTESLIKQITHKIGASPERTVVHLQIDGTEAEGVRLRGSLNKKRATAEIYWLRRRLRFITLAFTRADMHEFNGGLVWKQIFSSLKVEQPVIGLVGTAEPPPVQGDLVGKGVLNGKALELPPPAYPQIAKMARASGTVVVQVVIDEDGRVISAKAVSGHPLLHAVCVQAARGAKFRPTLLEGEPVSVTGVITYNFVAR